MASLYLTDTLRSLGFIKTGVKPATGRFGLPYKMGTPYSYRITLWGMQTSGARLFGDVTKDTKGVYCSERSEK